MKFSVLSKCMDTRQWFELPDGREFKLPQSEHTPVYRLLKGSVLSVEFAGAGHSAYRPYHGDSLGVQFG